MNGIESLPIPKERNLFLDKQVDQKSINALTKEIISINEHDQKLIKLYDVYGLTYTPKPINIYIDSYGGDVYQALGLISVIDASEVPVYTICTGSAKSAAFLILVCGHYRYCYKNSTMLYHQISTEYMFGTVKGMDEDLGESKRLLKKMEEIVTSRTKITKKMLREVYDCKVDWYLSATEAFKLQIVDEII